jgi:hypothetical protein
MANNWWEQTKERDSNPPHLTEARPTTNTVKGKNKIGNTPTPGKKQIIAFGDEPQKNK